MTHRDLQPEQEVVLAAAQIARTNPAQWGQLVKALTSYSAQITQNCIQSPIEELPRAQGRAQAVVRMASTLADAPALADKIEGRKK